MLNRTNLTQSALTNRLNLGTRALALNAIASHGKRTQRIRHVHLDVMRQKPMWRDVSPFSKVDYDIPHVPGSILPGSQQRPIRCSSQRPRRTQGCRSAAPAAVAAPG